MKDSILLKEVKKRKRERESRLQSPARCRIQTHDDDEMLLQHCAKNAPPQYYHHWKCALKGQVSDLLNLKADKWT